MNKEKIRNSSKKEADETTPNSFHEVTFSGIGIVKPLALLATAAFLTAGGIILTSEAPPAVEIIDIRENFTEELAVRFEEKIKASKADHIILRITSNGGSVVAMNEIKAVLKNSGKRISTYVPSWAASAGASTFMSADMRYIERGAKVMFHGAHLGSSKLTVNGLIETLRLVKSDKFKAFIESGTVPEGLNNLEKIDYLSASVAVISVGYKEFISEVSSTIRSLILTNKGAAQEIADNSG